MRHREKLDGQISQSTQSLFHRKTATCLLFLLLLTACSSTEVRQGYRVRSYLGWLTVYERASDDTEARIERVKSIGMKVGPGFGLGYFDDTVLSLPNDCRLVIFATDFEQMAMLFKTYPQLQKEGNPCIKSTSPQ